MEENKDIFDDDEILDGELREYCGVDSIEENEEADTENVSISEIDTEPGQGSEKRSGSHFQFAIGMLSGVLVVLLFIGFFIARLQMRQQSSRFYMGGLSERKVDLDYTEIDTKLMWIQELINTYFLNDIDNETVEEKLFDGVMESLDDPYSVYYTKEEYDQMEEATNGEYSGIGATLSQDPETGKVTVVNCFDDSPAMEAGVLSGDEITAINDVVIEEEKMDLTEVVSRIKTEKGETVKLSIIRGEEELEFNIERRKIEVPTVKGEVLNDHIGYIQLVEFDTVTAQQFEKELDQLKNEGIDSLIIDLRDNPGGVLQVVVNICDQILPEGLIVYTEDKNGNREEFTSDEEHKLEMPLVVLINENSASASEIFAGAVKDYGIGTLIGKTTFGKGIVQSLFELSDGSAIKLTVSKYFTPKGNDIHEKGVEPDIDLDLDLGDAEEYSKEADNQLQKAIKLLEE